jgi:putative flippase GtrA
MTNKKDIKNDVTEIDSASQAKDKEAAKQKKKTAIQAVKYALFTASAGIIQFVSFTIMTYAFENLDWGKLDFIVKDMDVTLFVATTVALCLSVLWNFTFNRKFTFKSAGNVPRAMALAFLFYVPFYPFQTWYVHSVTAALGGAAAVSLLAEGTVMLINGVLEFCWQKFVIYGKEEKLAQERKKYEEIGEYGEINVKASEFTGDELYELMSEGVDINAESDKKLRKRLDNQSKQ